MIRDRLGAFGLRLTDEEEVDSTNRLAADAARAGEASGLVVRARSQRRGRGRQGRTWSAAPGDALLASFLLRPRIKPESLPRVTLAAGLAVCEAARRAGLSPWIKWPNDVLIGRKKLAGILCEFIPGSPPGIVVGIGINLRTNRLPPEIASRAAEWNAGSDDVLVAVAERLVREVAAIEAGHWDDVRGRCEAAMTPMLGRSITVGRGSVASAIGLDEDGALLVRSSGESSRRVVAGDVHLGTEALECSS